jgi:hypothetical protein
MFYSSDGWSLINPIISLMITEIFVINGPEGFLNESFNNPIRNFGRQGTALS